MAQNVHLFLVRDESSNVVAGMLTSQTGSVLHNAYAASKKAALSKCPNDLFYWEVTRWACQNGLSAFDMERSLPGSGTVHFKKKFGGRPIKLYSYTYQELKGRRTTRPTQLPKWLPVFSSVWRRLPLRFAKVLGPFFRRRMPFA